MKNGLTLTYAVAFGDYIRKIRIEKGYSQYDVANALKISQYSYCMLENGRTKLFLERIILIAFIFKVEPEEFITRFLRECMEVV